MSCCFVFEAFMLPRAAEQLALTANQWCVFGFLAVFDGVWIGNCHGSATADALLSSNAR
jgi:hypothetical protein